MKKIGIKLADGSFYPIMEEGSATKKELNVTTVKDNQTTVKVGLYSSENSSMQDATYLDTLKISNLKKQPNGAPTIKLSLGLDDEGKLSAELVDSETGKEAKTSVTLLSDMLGNDKNPGTGKGLLNAAEEINASDGIALSEENLPLPSDEDFSEETALAEDLSFPEEAMPEETPAAEEEFSLPEETQIEEAAASDDISSLDEEPLPDIDENSAQDSSLQDFDLPDFDENIFPEAADEEDSKLPQSEIQEAFGTSGDELDFSDTDFEMPDFGESINGGTSFDDLPDFNSTDDALEDPFSDDGIFEDESDENEKTQKWPMIICLVCALICILAVLSLLFIIPSKFNLLISQDEKAQVEPVQEVTELSPPAVPKVEEIQVPIVPAAKEDEVVVIPQAELVVPDLPYGEEPKHKTKEILYKIKWGDTLWDLSATYYKNPWLYPKIAKYNNIKNPNYIVAGTYIKIPEE
ncbi:MAG: LysM peptidoglycan-binding domain-containing protein [Treponemataceae bacterium]|nr:LysM peptidoglycan-binding domain-containing protein [Treponemataceae bacterium]